MIFVKKKKIPHSQSRAEALCGNRREDTFSRERAGGQCGALSSSGCRGAWRGSPPRSPPGAGPALPSQPPGASRSPCRGFPEPREKPASGAGRAEVPAGRSRPVRRLKPWWETSPGKGAEVARRWGRRAPGLVLQGRRGGLGEEGRPRAGRGGSSAPRRYKCAA